MSVVIKLEDVSKQYQLGLISTRTLKGDLQRWWYNIRGLPDPTLIIGQENVINTSHSNDNTPYPDDYIWALKDINFEVEQGEVLGIIGKNGAGKSTLLKLLSRVTVPTKGSIKVRGRIASLLEVGTGFHPELTGRENIYLNGAILGMKKPEIRDRFDEIVDFSGCELYIDTPVKRYSSGMYVRLAFAVAAHLEPEILIVDEVLAVGDSEFQKKAVGKMKDISKGEGRTVLFVSHNMISIRQLCQNSILLDNGKVILKGITSEVVDYYQEISERRAIPVVTGNRQITLLNFSILDSKLRIVNNFNSFDEVNFSICYSSTSDIKNVTFSVCFNNEVGQRITSLWTSFINKKFMINKGDFNVLINVPCIHLIPGIYEIILYIESNGIVIERIDNFKKIAVGYSKKYGFVQIPTNDQGNYIEEFNIKVNK